MKARAAADLSESLKKDYSASDEAMMAIIQACNKRASVTPEPGAVPLSVEGTWSTEWQHDGVHRATIDFVQDGRRVLGTYAAAGSYEGELAGRVLSGTWKNNGSTGRFEFTFSQDGRSFIGKWGFGSEPLEYRQRGARSE